MNCGVHAGQSVPHLHIHLIPRYQGDMKNPLGGVRGVIPIDILPSLKREGFLGLSRIRLNISTG